MRGRLARVCTAALAIGVICLMVTIVLQVLFSALDVNPVARFGTVLPWVGDAVTLNSLLDVQWHLLVVTGLLPMGLVWLRNRHVRVDFLYNRGEPATRRWIDIVCNLFFAAPFFALVLPASWSFVIRAWTADEGSRNGGLNDLWLIKAVMPLGLGLLALAVAVETVRLVRTRQ